MPLSLLGRLYCKWKPSHVTSLGALLSLLFAEACQIGTLNGNTALEGASPSLALTMKAAPCPPTRTVCILAESSPGAAMQTATTSG